MGNSVRVTAAEFQEKHNRRTKAALEDMKKGVNAVSTAPGQQAAAKKDKMLNNLTAAVQSGKWGRRVASVTLEDWKDKMITKGAPRVSGGLDAAKDKTITFAGELIAHQNALLPKIHAMPDLTLSDSTQRAVSWIEGMAKMERKG